MEKVHKKASDNLSEQNVAKEDYKKCGLGLNLFIKSAKICVKITKYQEIQEPSFCKLLSQFDLLQCLPG